MSKFQAGDIPARLLASRGRITLKELYHFCCRGMLKAWHVRVGDWYPFPRTLLEIHACMSPTLPGAYGYNRFVDDSLDLVFDAAAVEMFLAELEEHRAAAQPAPAAPESQAEAGKAKPEKGKVRRKQTRGSVTQKDAAALCGVSVRTFQAWEKGEKDHPVPGFPGRGDLLVFKAWANRLQQQRCLEATARGMTRPILADPMDLDQEEHEDAWQDG